VLPSPAERKDLELLADDTIQIHTGWPSSDDERETHANFARRILHSAFKVMWEENGGGPVNFKTSNPEEWLRANLKVFE